MLLAEPILMCVLLGEFVHRFEALLEYDPLRITADEVAADFEFIVNSKSLHLALEDSNHFPGALLGGLKPFFNEPF